MTDGRHNTDDWSKFFSAFNVFTNSIRLETLIRCIQRYVPEGGGVLETGFGSGATARIFADMGYRVTAVDIDEKVVALGRKTSTFPVERLGILQMDMMNLGFGGKNFDCVYHQGVLEHFGDSFIASALKEQGRVARHVIFDVPNNRDSEQNYGDERFLSLKHWEQLIAQAGLSMIEYYGRMPPRWSAILPRLFFRNRGYWSSLCGRILGKSYIFVCQAAE